jgi:hypothetical protein
MRTNPLLALGVLLVVTGCSQQNPRVVTKFNQEASLQGSLPANPLTWKVITSTIDRPGASMSTLFGNDVAVQYARDNASHDYPAGSVLSLVTWKQQEDPRWFGGNIPAAPQSVEFVFVSAADRTMNYAYQEFEGSPLKKISTLATHSPEGRTAYLLSLRAAVMP